MSEINVHHWCKLLHDLVQTGIQEKGIILTHVLARNQIGQGPQASAAVLPSFFLGTGLPSVAAMTSGPEVLPLCMSRWYLSWAMRRFQD